MSEQRYRVEQHEIRRRGWCLIEAPERVVLCGFAEADARLIADALNRQGALEEIRAAVVCWTYGDISTTDFEAWVKPHLAKLAGEGRG